MTDRHTVTDELSKTARDVAYVAVGLGVLGFQRAQVRRRELTQRITTTLQGLTQQLDRVTQDLAGATAAAQQQMDRLGTLPTDLARTLGEVADRVEALIAKVEVLVEPFEQRLPSPAREVVQQARSQVTTARQQLRTLVLRRAA